MNESIEEQSGAYAAENPAPKSSRKSTANTKPSASNPAPIEKKEKASPLNAVTKAQLEALFVVKCLPPRDVAARLDIDVQRVYDYVDRYKLTAKRDARAKQIEQRALAKAESEVEQAMSRWSDQSEDLTETTFDLARKEAATKGKYTARNLQSLSQALKNFSGIYRESKGMSAGASGGTNTQVNIFLGNIPRAGDEPKRAEPVDV